MSVHQFADWPQQHRNLLGVTFLFLVLVAVGYFVFFRARVQELSDSRRALAKTQKKLQDTSWPNDASRLKRLLDGFNKDINGVGEKQGLKQIAESTLQRCTSLFAVKIQDAYGDDKNFMEKASQVEFKDEFDKLDSYFQGKGIFLAKTIFGLDDTSLDSSKYQMLLKVWTTEKLVNLALEHKLTVVSKHDPKVQTSQRNKPFALITALPINSYILNAGDKQPYLLEIPVKITVAGNMSRFLNFTEALQSEEIFLPITRLEIQAYPPNDKDKGNSEGLLIMDRIQATIVCSAFYRPQGDNLPKASKALKKAPLPPGA